MTSVQPCSRQALKLIVIAAAHTVKMDENFMLRKSEKELDFEFKPLISCTKQKKAPN